MKKPIDKMQIILYNIYIRKGKSPTLKNFQKNKN